MGEIIFKMRAETRLNISLKYPLFLMKILVNQ